MIPCTENQWSVRILAQQKGNAFPKRFVWKQINTAEKCGGRLVRGAPVFFQDSQWTVNLISDGFGTEHRRKRNLLNCDSNRK